MTTRRTETRRRAANFFFTNFFVLRCWSVKRRRSCWRLCLLWLFCSSACAKAAKGSKGEGCLDTIQWLFAWFLFFRIVLLIIHIGLIMESRSLISVFKPNSLASTRRTETHEGTAVYKVAKTPRKPISEENLLGRGEKSCRLSRL